MTGVSSENELLNILFSKGERPLYKNAIYLVKENE